MEIRGMPQCKMNCNHVSFPLEQSSFQNKMVWPGIISSGLPSIDPFGYEKISSVHGHFIWATFISVKILPDAEKWIQYMVEFLAQGEKFN
jgi:hypothetical protein